MNFNYGSGAAALGGLSRGIDQGLDIARFRDDTRRRDQAADIAQQNHQQQRQINDQNLRLNQLRINMAELDAADRADMDFYDGVLNQDQTRIKKYVPEGATVELSPTQRGAFSQYPTAVVRGADGSIIRTYTPGRMAGVLSKTSAGKQMLPSVTPEMWQYAIDQIGSLFSFVDCDESQMNAMVHDFLSGFYGSFDGPQRTQSNPVEFYRNYRERVRFKDPHMAAQAELILQAKEFAKAALQAYSNDPNGPAASSALNAQRGVRTAEEQLYGMIPTNWLAASQPAMGMTMQPPTFQEGSVPVSIPMNTYPSQQEIGRRVTQGNIGNQGLMTPAQTQGMALASAQPDQDPALLARYNAIAAQQPAITNMNGGANAITDPATAKVAFEHYLQRYPNADTEELWASMINRGIVTISAAQGANAMMEQ